MWRRRSLVTTSRSAGAPARGEPPAPPLAEAAFERKVLAIFMPNGRIVQLPARLKKRMVILRWLAGQFRPGERYTEAQVSELLSRYHEDYALLRRLLVDHELMQRKRGLYWRAGTMPFPD